jgi:hypothetical protein
MLLSNLSGLVWLQLSPFAGIFLVILLIPSLSATCHCISKHIWRCYTAVCLNITVETALLNPPERLKIRSMDWAGLNMSGSVLRGAYQVKLSYTRAARWLDLACIIVQRGRGDSQ